MRVLEVTESFATGTMEVVRLIESRRFARATPVAIHDRGAVFDGQTPDLGSKAAAAGSGDGARARRNETVSRPLPDAGQAAVGRWPSHFENRCSGGHA